MAISSHFKPFFALFVIEIESSCPQLTVKTIKSLQNGLETARMAIEMAFSFILYPFLCHFWLPFDKPKVFLKSGSTKYPDYESIFQVKN